MYRAALVPPRIRAQAARDIHESGVPLQEAVWWERAVYERAVRAFERKVLTLRIRCDASAYMTYAAARVPDLYYPHELRVLHNQVRIRSGWESVRELVDGTVLRYAELTTEELRSGLPIHEWITSQERMEVAHNDKLSSAPSFASSTSTTSACRKCRSTRVTVNLRQLKSADEPMTQCFECLEPSCRHQWRIG